LTEDSHGACTLKLKTYLKLKAKYLHWLINAGSSLSLVHKVLL